MQDGGFVGSFYFQVPGWAVLVVLAIVLFGGWKVGKLIWSALSH